MNRKSFFVKWKLMQERDASVTEETLHINVNRQYHLSLIAMPVSLLHIVYFYFFLTPTTFAEEQWRVGIMSAHTVLLLLSSFAFLLTNRYRTNKELPVWMRAFLLLQMIFFLLIGAIIASIDQLVTPIVTPFFISTIIVGVVFLIPLVQVIVIYVFGYIVYFYAIGQMQVLEAVVASNRVNGLTMISLGMGLSYILWKAHCTTIMQSRYIQKQQDDLEKKNEELFQLASIDLLTGLYSRRHFEGMMKEKLKVLQTKKEPFSVILMDIDRFKRINDNWGHPVGDVVLKEVSRCLLEVECEDAIIARWGGEEFIIALLGTSIDQAVIAAEAFRQALENTPVVVDDQVINVTASFGIAQVHEVKDYHSFEKAYGQADQALYEAKQSGRNCVKTFG